MTFRPSRYFFLACFIVIGVILDSIWRWIRNRRINSLMKSRLSNNSAFEEIVPALNNPALIDGTRTTLEKILSINLERIQPEDRFDRELDMDPKGDKGMLRFISLLEEKYDIDLPHCAACMKMTFGELVTLIDQKTQSLDNNDIPDTRKNSPTESHQHTGKAD